MFTRNCLQMLGVQICSTMTCRLAEEAHVRRLDSAVIAKSPNFATRQTEQKCIPESDLYCWLSHESARICIGSERRKLAQYCS